MKERKKQIKKKKKIISKSIQLYNQQLNKIEKELGNKSTYSSQLTDYGTRMFGDKYRGTYAADTLPTLTKKRPYCIGNLDKKNEGGSHWIALAKSGKDVIFYDSFGRKAKSIIDLEKKVLNTEDDAEQDIFEENCGQRCLAWLYVFDKMGKKEALQI